MSVKQLILILFLALFIQSAQCLQAFASKLPYPIPAGHLLDEPGALKPGVRSALDQILSEHEKATGEQIVVAVFKGLDGEEPIAWTKRIFSHWKIGMQSRESGVLLALYWKDRSALMEAGYGIEAVLNRNRRRHILFNVLVPELKASRPDRAVSFATMEILRVLESPLVSSGQASRILRLAGIDESEQFMRSGKAPWWIWLMCAVAGIGLLIFTLKGKIRRRFQRGI
ncbi:MAG: TPM domain-containing protein [Bdellovibrionota bacterium]